MSSAVEEIRIKLSTRLREVEAEVESLRTALEALDAQAAEAAEAATARTDDPPAPAPREATARGRRPAVSRARTPRATGRASREPEAGARLADLEALLAETGGPEAVALARATGTDPAEVLARIGELERAGRGAR